MDNHSLVTRTFGLLALALAAACSDGGGTETPLESTDMAMPVTIPAQRSTIGDACSAGKAPRGTCSGDDTVCFTNGQFGLPGGMCTQDCTSTGCPSDAACVRTDVGDLCLALCNTNADCRGPDYVCADYKACVPALGFYAGYGVRPGSKDGEACGTAPMPGSQFLPSLQVSTLSGSQVALAVDDAAGNVVVAWQDLFDGAGIFFSSSQDGGATFSAPQALPIRIGTQRNAAQLDPAAAVDSTGAFYLVWTGTGADPDQVYIASSTDGGESFGIVSVVAPADESAADTLSKPHVAIAADDTIYVSWSVAMTGARQVRLTRSLDHGVTWDPPVTVTPDDAVNHENARLAISGDGTVYATWVEVGGDPLGDTKNSVAVQRLKADLTLDGTAVKISGTEAVPQDVPSIAVVADAVHVAYTAGKPDGAWDIKVAGSINRGTTFSASSKVNSDASCATHFHPSAALDGAGKLHVVYFDNRGGQGSFNQSVATTPLGGSPLTFAAEDAVSDMGFYFTTESGYYDWLGDYVGLSIAGTHIYAAWPDTRTNDTAQVMFTTAGL